MANGPTTQQMTRPARPARTIGDLILARRDSFAAVLPKHMTPDRFMKVAMAALTKTPKLQDCSPESLLMALAACSELGLEPNSPLGHAYLIPYGKDCQLVIGFKGLLAIARRSGEIGSISVRVVYARDVFEVSYGDEEKILHVPFQPKVKFSDKGEPIGFDGPENAGNVVAAYMIAHLKDGSIQREVMGVADIMAIKSRSKSGNSGPWKSDFAEMARKTVFRRGWKWLPQSTEMAKAVEYDDDRPEDIAGGRPAIDVSFQMAAPAATRGDAMAAELEAQATNQVAQGGAETTVQEPAAASPATPPPSDSGKRPDVAEADAPPDTRGDFE